MEMKVITDREGEDSDMTEEEYADFTEKLKEIGGGKHRGFVIMGYDLDDVRNEVQSIVKAHEYSRADVFNAVMGALQLDSKDVYKLAAGYQMKYE